MTKLILTVILATPALLQPGAQTATATQPHELTPDQVLARYDRQLTLTADQKTKLRPVIADRQQGMAALKNNAALSPHDKQVRMQQLRADSTKRINEVLTPEQQKKYAALEGELRSRR